MPNTIAGSTLLVEVALGANPDADPATYTWTDISNYVKADGVSIRRGRSDYATHAEAMTCSLTVNNSDGRFTPGNRAGAYWPNMRKSLPLRVTMDGSVRFLGYIDSLPITWPSQVTTLAWAPITASGRWRRLSRNPQVTAGTLQRAITAGGWAAYYWPLEDGPGTVSAYSLVNEANDDPVIMSARTSGVAWGDVDGMPGFAGKTVSLSAVQANLYAQMPNDTVNMFMGFQVAVRIPDLPVATGDYSQIVVELGSGTVSTPLRRFTISTTAPSDGSVTVTARLLAGDGTTTYPYWQWSTTSSVLGGWLLYRLALVQDTGYPGPSVRWKPTFTINATTLTASPDAGYVYETVIPFASDRTPARSVTLYGGGVGSPLTAEYPTGYGHLAIAWDTPTGNNYSAAYAWDQETAADRYTRVVGELFLPGFTPPAATTVMGPQTLAPSLDVLYETADAEIGFLYETTNGRTAFQARGDRYNPAVFMALDIAQGHVFGGFAPTFDDQKLINDVTVSRPAGSSYRYVNAASALAYGTYHQDVTLNLGRDVDLPGYASWLASINADPNQARIAGLQLNLRTIGATLQGVWLGSEPLGKLLTVASPPSQMAQVTLGFFIEGYTEMISVDRWEVSLNLSPAFPFTNVFVLEGSGDSGRLGMSGQTVNTSATAGATSLSLATSAGNALFITTALHPASFPVDLNIDGRKVTCTASSGTSSPQTLTVTALPAAVAAGVSVDLWNPAYLAL